MPVAFTKEPFGPHLECPSILLASDTERLGTSLHRVLRDEGFQVRFAGDYSGLDVHLTRENYDVVLLEVTGEYAVEEAVATALRLKRANAAQFVGYVADSLLESSGLAGDGIFPRNSAKLPEALRRFFSDEAADTSKHS